ncbi:MAG: GAF domain-containing protein, partial [Burkholderiaceae bacterium]|nr:GAF domain-containing protein [Burkholderiaceae bacterium]
LAEMREQALAAANENARLRQALDARTRELDEAREQQAATSEILRVISRSPSDVQSVFDTIIRNATRLCQASLAFAMLHVGGRLTLAARTACTPEFADYLEKGFEINRETTTARAAIEGKPVQILDFIAEPDVRVTAAHLRERVHTVLAVPLLRDRSVLGVFSIWRHEVQPFSEHQIALLQTFADQAVIAIENMRLFNELEARTAQLARSVEQLRALGEVGDAVSSTLDLETVLRTIVSRANQLAGMEGGAIYEYEEARQEFLLRATDQMPDELVEALRSSPLRKGEGAIGRLAITGEPATVRDIADEDAYHSRVREILLGCGYRSLLAVPLLRNERLIGGLVVSRRRAGGFDPRVIDLLKSFATQSALAIQNARLYRQVEEKSRQLEVASRHKSAFLTTMSHELRTPLNAIIGFTRIVMRHSHDRLEPKQNENLGKILASGQHLLSLIDAILDLARIEAGRIEIEPGEIELVPVLEECTRSVEPLVRSTVMLARRVEPGLPRMLVDEGKLRQIVINLLGNAAKFTANGRIEVSAHRVDDRIEIGVADTGIGIAADKLEQIFGEFEQLDTGADYARTGTGLGLAIARRLARLMGGDVRVASVPDAGSTFTLTLPVRYQASAA